MAQQRRISDGAVLCEWRFPGSPRVTCPEFVEGEGKVKLLFTTADRKRLDGERCLQGYRLRWQIELQFKRWKSLRPSSRTEAE